MIRRDDGNDWLILSQIDHARIAAELAARWSTASPSFGSATDLMLAAVRDHDEGWREWEAAIQIDPANGVPRQFTEMPSADGAVIWGRSIEFCAKNHPLAGIWVSRHFCYLAEQSLSSQPEDSDDVKPLRSFLDEQARFQQHNQDEALEDLTEREFAVLSQFGFLFLRLFDSLSLWVCCARRTRPLDVRVNDQSVRLIPLADGRIRVAPYVLLEEDLTVSLPTRRIPARTYASDADLQHTLDRAPTEVLAWTFCG